MTSPSRRSSSPPSETPRLQSKKSRNFANRFGSLFASKPSHVNDYYIQLDDHARVYGAGDTLSGTFVLDVARPLGVTHIVISLFGYLEVFKTHARSRTDHRDSVSRVASGKGKRWVSEYYGDGFASLFEDEVVLCGQGRLDPKLYHFRFELDFPRNLRLPSSIWFERGTVRYVVSATLTRPTTMSPTTVTSRKLEFRESIDIASAPVPRPWAVTLEPIERGSRPRVVRRAAPQTPPNDSGAALPLPSSLNSQGDSASTATTQRQQAQSGDGRVPTPPTPSIASTTSGPWHDSTSPADSRSYRLSSSPRLERGSSGGFHDPLRTITAVVQLARGGCLPGEILNLTVSINHTKPVKSVRGLVVTLYRQARVDMHPHLPLGGPAGAGAGKPHKYEDYYPRSRTGIGGLSLEAAGSGQVWRKDLCQTFAPLYVNPMTLSAVVKTAVRVPDEAFPTFRNAPGDMINFKYFVEVIIDIHGKLAEQSVLSENVNMPNSRLDAEALQDIPILEEGQQALRWSMNCIDTTQMRRDKNSLVCVTDLIVGTKDSGKNSTRARGPREDDRTSDGSRPHGRDSDTGTGPVASSTPASDATNGARSRQADTPIAHARATRSEAEQWHEYGDDQAGYWQGDYHDESYDPYASYDMELEQPEPYDYQPSAHHGHPDDGLTEKERLRRIEESLLPSQPPGAEEGPSDYQPSAPYIPNEDEFENADAFRDAVWNNDRPRRGRSHDDYLDDVPAYPVPTYTAQASAPTEATTPAAQSAPQTEPRDPPDDHGPRQNEQ